MQYIHLNPAELFERNWKSGDVKNMRLLEQKLEAYRYSSLPDYEGVQRPENSILDNDAVSMFDRRPPLGDMLIEAAEYYADLKI